MKKVFQITDKQIINEVLDKAEYGMLAVCHDNDPLCSTPKFCTYSREHLLSWCIKKQKDENARAKRLCLFFCGGELLHYRFIF